MDLPRSCIIITGPQGSGKTRSARRIIEALASAGRRVSALIQPDEGRGPEGLALGFSLEFLTGASGQLAAERVALARSLESGELPSAGYLALGRFAFDRSAFVRAEGFFAAALAARPAPEALVLDEIGRLELLRGEGLMPCLELALEAVSLAGAEAKGPRALLCSAREDCVVELRRMAQVAGLLTETFEASRAGDALSAALRAVGP